MFVLFFHDDLIRNVYTSSAQRSLSLITPDHQLFHSWVTLCKMDNRTRRLVKGDNKREGTLIWRQLSPILNGKTFHSPQYLSLTLPIPPFLRFAPPNGISPTNDGWKKGLPSTVLFVLAAENSQWGWTLDLWVTRCPVSWAHTKDNIVNTLCPSCLVSCRSRGWNAYI